MTSSARLRANRLLGAASAWGLSGLEVPLEERSLHAGEPLCAVQDATTELLFPRAGLVALLALTPDGKSAGAAIVGAEGAVGAAIALGLGRSPWDALVIADGASEAMPAAIFRAIAASEPEFLKAAAAYARSLFEVSDEALACAKYHQPARRLATWLGLLDDRARLDPVTSTAGLLATLIGSTPATVLELAATLDGVVVEDARGTLDDVDAAAEAGTAVVVTERVALGRQACGCFAGAPR